MRMYTEVLMKKQPKMTWCTGALVLATCGAMAAMSSAARADIVLIAGANTNPAFSFVDLGAQGFGNAPRLLTLQTPNGMTDIESGSGTPTNQANGDASSGTNKTSTPTIQATGWTSGAKVGIGFNADQTGGSGITMQSLVLTIYNATGTLVEGTFNLNPAPVQFSAANLALEPGNGNAVFNFHLTPAQQALFDAILAMPGSANFLVGLASTLGCTASSPPGCMAANDGPDSFVAFAQAGQPVVPLPGTLSLFITGLVGLGLLTRRKRKAIAA
jgi:hypothetical protein